MHDNSDSYVTGTVLILTDEDHVVKHHVQSYVLLVGLLLEILFKSLLFPYTVNALNELKYFFSTRGFRIRFKIHNLSFSILCWDYF